MNPLSKISVRRATPADLVAYSGRGMPEWCWRWHGWAAEREGEIVGLGIVCRDQQKLVSVWADMVEGLSPFLLHRLATKALAELREQKVKLVRCYCDESKPRAADWLLRLGFLPTETVLPDHGRVFVCDLT